MLQINGKTFMNLQEAVQWLLDNNALPFQSSANYVANTEIGMGTIVNPSPAKVRIGSLIFFADSKVSTVIGLTENGFICSDQYNNLVDDVAYVTGVAINASGHLITTMSDGQTIDAGLVKQLSNFSINASQHLIATYNDGTTTDLGAIFNGNVNISGNLTADSIIENMSGYSFTKRSDTSTLTRNYIYCGACKNGNKITFVYFLSFRMSATQVGDNIQLGTFIIPKSVGNQIYPYTLGGIPDVIASTKISIAKAYDTYSEVNMLMFKQEGTSQDAINASLYQVNTLDLNTDYLVRVEQTFLLGSNLAS